MSALHRAYAQVTAGTALAATAGYFALESLAVTASGSGIVPSTGESMLWFVAVVVGVPLFVDGAARLVAARVRTD